MAKKDQPKRVIKLIKKSNELVEARYKFDIRETRVFTKMLTLIEMADEEFKSYRIYLNDIVKEMGIENSKASYERLRMG